MARMKCPACGKAALETIVEPTLEKLFEGVSIVIKDACISRCPVCKEETYSAGELRRWREIKQELLKSRGQLPTGMDVEQVRNQHELSVADLASLLGVTRQTVHAWVRTRDAAMKFGPAAILILLLMQELNGTIGNVFATLLSFAKKRGQLTSVDKPSSQTDPQSSATSRLTPPRSFGAPTFAPPAGDYTVGSSS